MSDLLRNFATGMPQTTLTEIGGAISGRMQQVRAAKLQAQQEQAYQDALYAYMQDQSPENRVAVLEAGRPMGRFEEVETTVAGYDTATREADARELASIVGPLYAGNTDRGAAKLRELGEAYAASGDSDDMEKAQEYRLMADAVEDGKADEVVSALSLQGSFTEEGTRVLDNLHAMGKDERARAATEMDILKAADDMDISKDLIPALIDVAKDKNMGTAQDIFEYAALMPETSAIDGMDAKELVNTILPLENLYNKQTKDYREILRNADNMRSAVLSSSGIADAAVITAFNKILDPGSVVRQAEFANTERGQAVLDRVLDLQKNVSEGSILADQTIQEIVAVTELIELRTKEMIAEEQESVGVIADAVGIDRGLIFQDALNMDEVRENRIKGILKTMNKGNRATIDAIESSTLEELSENAEYREVIDAVNGAAWTYTPPAGSGTGGGPVNANDDAEEL